ncbi:hypothetical protein BofuT4_uP018600.1 [Botrytis cinerea T4]|uniref:Uncharacterized protein n=1 Tax=Botryotinia fuckeliana (strain T4) TaxID=999810 RepID=G2YIL7_BOTF4|nr:hypothetical protein BofuT4_uP018600.1 [Botrytis cinerea T4]
MLKITIQDWQQCSSFLDTSNNPVPLCFSFIVGWFGVAQFAVSLPLVPILIKLFAKITML